MLLEKVANRKKMQDASIEEKSSGAAFSSEQYNFGIEQYLNTLCLISNIITNTTYGFNYNNK